MTLTMCQMEDPLAQTLLNAYENKTEFKGHEQVIGGGTFVLVVNEVLPTVLCSQTRLDTMHQANEFIALMISSERCNSYAEAIYELIK